MDLSRPLTGRHEIYTQVWCGVRPATCDFFTPSLKIWQKETSNFAHLPPTRRPSEARNFEKAQHIDEQKPDISSTINALKRYLTWSHHPTEF